MDPFGSGHCLVLWALWLILFPSSPYPLLVTSDSFLFHQALTLTCGTGLRGGGEPQSAISDFENRYLTAFVYPDYFTLSGSDFYFVLLGGSGGGEEVACTSIHFGFDSGLRGGQSFPPAVGPWASLRTHALLPPGVGGAPVQEEALAPAYPRSQGCG